MCLQDIVVMICMVMVMVKMVWYGGIGDDDGSGADDDGENDDYRES